MQRYRVISVSLLLLLLFGGACSEAQAEESYPPMPAALAAMESDGSVTVETVHVAEWEDGSNFYYAFKPTYQNPKIGFIFYPGGLVDPRAYAPPVRAIAAKGYVVVIVKMKNDLAVYSADRADRIISDYPQIKTWIIGGHSIGGSFSCYYAKHHTDTIAGVVLWAAWPSEYFRLDDTDLKAISIYGTKDGAPDEILAGAEHLPAGTPFIAIEGGNHTQFGYYWDGVNENFVQEGDNPADISREEQQTQIITATVDFLAQFTATACPVTMLLGAGDTRLGTMRQLRDVVLANSFAGKKLIEFYYAYGNRITAGLEQHPALKDAVKKALVVTMPLIEWFVDF